MTSANQGAEDYAEKVCMLLRPYFADLDKPITGEIIREAIARHAATPNDAFEVLLDERGNWRLKPARREEPGRIRVACYRFNERDEDRELVERLNGRLATIR